jgi:hypothetical protein
MDALSRSKELLKSTWGEQLSANFGFGVLAFVMALPILLLVILLFPLFPNGLVPFVIVMIYGMALMLFTSTMSGIFQAALYLYAREGAVSSQFDESELRNAFSDTQNR